MVIIQASILLAIVHSLSPGRNDVRIPLLLVLAVQIEVDRQHDHLQTAGHFEHTIPLSLFFVTLPQ